VVAAREIEAELGHRRDDFRVNTFPWVRSCRDRAGLRGSPTRRSAHSPSRMTTRTGCS